MTTQATARPLEVLCFGETIIDFLPDRRARLRDVESFRKIVGGAPANVALGLARLGRRSGLMSKVGEDEFGHFLLESLAKEGVCTLAMIPTNEAPTGFTFVSLTPDGERSFTSPKIITADETLRIEEVDLSQIDRAEMMLFGTNQMVTPKLRDAAMLALRTAHQRDRFVAFDPNIRLHLWDDTRRVLPCMNEAIPNVDLVKLNDEEIDMLGRGMSAEQIYTEWFEPAGVTALIATYASGGAEVFCGDFRLSVDAPDVEVIDTTGAGDGFVAGVLSAICGLTEDMNVRSARALRARLRAWDVKTWRHILELGCFVGSHVCTTLGATTGLPTLDQVPERIKPKNKVPVTQASLAEVKATT
jgi:fructokinase